MNTIHIGEFEYYDGLAVADVTGDEEEEVLMADRDDYIHIVDAYYPRSALEAFKANTNGQDAIYFSGHGNTNVWGPALLTDDFPLNFNNTKPFVFAPSCLTGNYEGNNDNSIAESFMNNDAAVYIGGDRDLRDSEKRRDGHQVLRQLGAKRIHRLGADANRTPSVGQQRLVYRYVGDVGLRVQPLRRSKDWHGWYSAAIVQPVADRGS